MNKIRNKDYKKQFLLLTLALALAVMLSGAVSAGTPLAENQSGTVSGDLYVNISQPVKFGSQNMSGTNTLEQPNTLPNYTSIDSAYVYVNIYSGSGSNNYPVNATIKLDGNGDGDYDDPGEVLGNEHLSTSSYSPDGTVYWVNDHAMRVYSDYQVWYDVTDLITSQNPTLYVNTVSNKDGRIKMLALVVAYNDGDNDQVNYWVLNGQDWINTGSSSSTFNTSTLNCSVASATLNTVALSSTDGTYNFNGNALSGGLIESTDPTDYFKEHSWDVTNYMTPMGIPMGDSTPDASSNSILTYTIGQGAYSLKMNLATLAVRSLQVDLTIDGTVETVPNTAVFAKETNTVTVNNVKNNGPDTANDIVVALYASDVDNGNTAVASTTIDSLAGGAKTTLTLVDPTIRNLEGGTVTYTAKVDPYNYITETDETNNEKSSTAKPLKYNGYKGKRYWEGGSDITTNATYDLRGDLVYYTQPSSYKRVGWTDRTETWNTTNLPIPTTGTVEDALLYLSYNWDITPGGVPNWVVTFNGNALTLGTPYIDHSNFGYYANHKYGLYVVNVTNHFNKNGNNTLFMTPGASNSNALYPSTLAVVYSDPSMSRKQIFLNQEADVLINSPLFGTTAEEATAYAPFTGLTIDTTKVNSAMLHSFAGSAGPDEGNLLFNNNIIAENGWGGNDYTASALVVDVTDYLSTSNEAAIQETLGDTILTIQQFLVVEYNEEPPVADFTAAPLTGIARDVNFTDTSTNDPYMWRWEYNNGSGWVQFSTEQNPTHYFTPGAYDIRLIATNDAGSHSIIKTHYVSVATGREPVTTIQSGVVSGGLYVSSPNTYPATEVNQTFNLPDAVVGNIDWARLFVNTYSGSAQNTYGLISTVRIDANGDGDYDDPGEILGEEIMDIASETNGNSYPLNDHVNKVYSDYEAWYDITSLLTTNNPTVNVKSSPLTGKSFDGKIKALTLIVAYNDGDNDQVYYWVNHGGDWSSPGNGQTTFNTTRLVPGWDSAESTIRYISSSDASYTFNGEPISNSVPPNYGGALNTWDVTDNITYDDVSTLAYSKTSGSYKTTLATLAVKYGLPDLQVTDITAPSNPLVGGTYYVPITITNTGPTNAGPFTVKIYDGTTAIAWITIPSLDAGDSTTETFKWKPTTNGTHTITIITDYYNEITESNENNNQYTQEITVN